MWSCRHGEPCPFICPAESSWEQICLRATEAQWAWVPAFLLPLLRPVLTHISALLPPSVCPSVFLDPYALNAKAAELVEHKVSSLLWWVEEAVGSKSGGGSQGEGELSARGAVSHWGFSCLRSCAPGCYWQCQAACTEEAGLISPASLILALLPATSGIHMAKLVQFFSLARRISLGMRDLVGCNFCDLKSLMLWFWEKYWSISKDGRMQLGGWGVLTASTMLQLKLCTIIVLLIHGVS